MEWSISFILYRHVRTNNCQLIKLRSEIQWRLRTLIIWKRIILICVFGDDCIGSGWSSRWNIIRSYNWQNRLKKIINYKYGCCYYNDCHHSAKHTIIKIFMGDICNVFFMGSARWLVKYSYLSNFGIWVLVLKWTIRSNELISRSICICFLVYSE